MNNLIWFSHVNWPYARVLPIKLLPDVGRQQSMSVSMSMSMSNSFGYLYFNFGKVMTLLKVSMVVDLPGWCLNIGHMII